MEVYFQAFVNFKYDNWVKFLLMAKFTYNNIKNARIGHMPFELNCSYYPQASYNKNVNFYFQVSYNKDINPCSKSKLTNKVLNKLKKLITIYKENF